MTLRTERPARRPRLRTWIAAGLTTTSLLCVAGSASAASSLEDTFEAGRTSGWSQQANTTVGTAYAREGTYGARSVSTPTQLGYLMWNKHHITQDQRYARIGGWFRIQKFTAGESVSIAVVRNAHGVNHYNMWRNPSTGRLHYDLFRGDHARSTMRAEIGRWYFIEAIVDYGDTATNTYTARVRIDGIDQPTIRSTGQVGTTVRTAFFGDTALGNSSTRYYDNLELRVSDSPLDFSR